MKSKPHPLSLQEPLVMRSGTSDAEQKGVTVISRDRPSVVVQRFVDGAGAAEYLCMSPRTLEKYRVTGGGPRFRRFGRRIVYSIEDLDRWADEQPTLRSTSDSGSGGRKASPERQR